jgi:hypothetical protein
LALSPVKIALAFQGGVDTNHDRKQVAPVKVLDLQNAVFTQDTTLIKRTGYRALGRSIEAGGGDYSGALALGSRDNELLTFTAAGTYSYRPLANNHALTGNPLSITAAERPIAKTGTEQSQADAGGQNDVTVAAWVDSRGGIWWEVIEESTGRVLRPPAQLSTVGAQPRVVPAGGVGVHVYFADQAAHVLWVAVIDTTNPTALVAPLQLLTDLSPNVGYDVCQTTLDVVIGGSTPIAPPAIVWATDVGTIRLGYVDPTGVVGSVTTNLPPPVIAAIFTPTPGNTIGIAYSATQGLAYAAWRNDTPTLQAAVWDLLLTAATTTAATTVPIGISTRTTAVAWAGTRLYLLVEDTTGATSERDTRLWSLYIDVAIGNAVNVLPAPFPLRGLSAASRIFVDGSVPYAYAVHDVPFFSVYLLIRITDGVVVARTMPTAAHGTQVNGTSIWTSTASQDPTDPRRWRIPLLANVQLQALAGQFAETGIAWVTLDFADPSAWQNEQLGRGLYLAGAAPSHYDGNRWAEMGFHVAPDGVITGTPAAGAGLLNTGTYTYQIWYEETDAQGEVHRGPTSVGTSVALTGGQNQVTITGPMYRCATGRRSVRVCIARGPVGIADELFRVTSLDPTTAAAPANGYIANDPTVDTWTFVDRMSDAVLLLQNPLYTTGGVLSNDPAPMAGGVLAVGKNRLFFTDPADPTMIRYTQELAEGFAAEMAAPLRQRLDPFGGAVTALAIMDGAVYPFRETAVYVVGGPGPLPDPTAQPDTFSFTPGDVVTSDVGCTTPQSIVTTPDGLAFKSAKGWRRIGRDRKVVDIGQDARGFDSQGVSAATLIPRAQRILLLTGDATGSTLLYDYQRSQWSRFTNHVGIDALILNGLYYYLRTDGRIFVETPGLYKDDNSHIPMVIEMAWLKMAGYLQGWQQIWYAQFVGEYKSAHTLRVRFRLNYELQWSANFDLDVDGNFTASVYGSGAYGAGPYGSTGSSVYQRRIHIGKPCQAIQFQIQDVEQTANFGAAFELSELVLTGGIKGNLYKLEAARSS